MKLLDGKIVSRIIKERLKEKISAQNYKIKLTVILIGEDPASTVYVNSKHKTCAELDINSEIIKKPAETTEKELLEIITALNNDPEVDGILCQLPVPGHINSEAVINAISPEKDVDCFHPVNVGRLFSGNPVILPCTPAGIIEMLDHYQVEISGKNCVVIGRSNIVGKPIAQLLLQRHGTVTICHSRTQNMSEIISRADIVCAAVGKAEFIKGKDLKEGAVVIDVGMNRVPDKSRKKGYRLCGDVDFESAAQKASFITPVPGGVGPMTIACLMQNVLACHLLRQNK